MSTASENDGSKLPACKKDYLYWFLVLTVMKNISRNSFTTVIIELLYIIDRAYAVAHLTTSLYPKYSSNLECLIRLENKLFLTAPNPKTTSHMHGKIVCTVVSRSGAYPGANCELFPPVTSMTTPTQNKSCPMQGHVLWENCYHRACTSVVRSWLSIA